MEHKKWRRRGKKGDRALPHYHLQELTGRFLEGVNQLGARQLDQIKMGWPSIVGDVIANKSQLVGFQENTLQVRVSHSTVLSVLSGPEKPRLLRILQKRFPKIEIRDISFRIG